MYCAGILEIRKACAHTTQTESKKFHQICHENGEGHVTHTETGSTVSGIWLLLLNVTVPVGILKMSPTKSVMLLAMLKPHCLVLTLKRLSQVLARFLPCCSVSCFNFTLLRLAPRLSSALSSILDCWEVCSKTMELERGWGNETSLIPRLIPLTYWRGTRVEWDPTYGHLILGATGCSTIIWLAEGGRVYSWLVGREVVGQVGCC